MGRRGKFLSWSGKGVRVGYGSHKTQVVGGGKGGRDDLGCGVLLFALLIIGGVFCAAMLGNRDQDTSTTEAVAAIETQIESSAPAAPPPPRPVSLPRHIFQRAPSGRRHQVRAIVERGTSIEELERLAVVIAKGHYSRDALTEYVVRGQSTCFLVHFFDDEICLTGWDGTGAVNDRDRPHHVGWVLVDQNIGGTLYARQYNPPFE